MPAKNLVRVLNLADSLREAMKSQPWLVLGLMSELTAEQWERLTNGESFVRLGADLKKTARSSLAVYPKLASGLAADVGGDTLVKLLEGKFLKNFDDRGGQPRAYLLKCGRNLSRVLVRSLWRQYLRDRGLPPMRSKPKPTSEVPDGPEERDAA